MNNPQKLPSPTPRALALRARASHFILVAALLLGLSAAAMAQSYRIPSGYSSELIQVKLEEVTSPSAIQTVIPSALRSRTTEVKPLFTVDPQRLVALRQRGLQRTGRATKDLRLWFEVRVAPGADAAELITALRAVPG